MKAISRVALAQVHGIMIRGNKVCLCHSLPFWDTSKAKEEGVAEDETVR